MFLPASSLVGPGVSLERGDPAPEELHFALLWSCETLECKRHWLSEPGDPGGHLLGSRYKTVAQRCVQAPSGIILAIWSGLEGEGEGGIWWLPKVSREDGSHSCLDVGIFSFVRCVGIFQLFSEFLSEGIAP